MPKEPKQYMHVKGSVVHSPACKRPVARPEPPKSSGPDVISRRSCRVGNANVPGYYLPGQYADAMYLAKGYGSARLNVSSDWIRFMYRSEWGRHRHPLPMYWSWDEMFDLFTMPAQVKNINRQWTGI